MAEKNEVMQQVADVVQSLSACITSARGPTDMGLEDAATRLAESASKLFARSKGRGVAFVVSNGSLFVAGQPFRFEEDADATREVIHAMSGRHVSILQLASEPGMEGARELARYLAPLGGPSVREAAEAGGFRLFDTPGPKEPRRASLAAEPGWLAVRAYAELVLSLQEQRTRVQCKLSGQEGPVPRFRALRALQDLYEITRSEPALAGRLVATHRGADVDDLAAANAAVAAILLGSAIGLGDTLTIDLAAACLFATVAQGDLLSKDRGVADRSFAAIVGEAHVFWAGYRRAVIVSERRVNEGELLAWEKTRPPPNALGRMAKVCVTLGGLVAGVDRDDGGRATLLQALDALRKRPHAFDEDAVDVLMNVLRAFPEGVEVVLTDGSRAVVSGHTEGSRWDEPDVLIDAYRPQSLASGQGKILGTARHTGQEPILEGKAQELAAKQRAGAGAATRGATRPMPAKAAPPAPKAVHDDDGSLDLGLEFGGPAVESVADEAGTFELEPSRATVGREVRSTPSAKTASRGPVELELSSDDDAPMELELERNTYEEPVAKKAAPAGRPASVSKASAPRAASAPKPAPVSDDDDVIDLGL